MYGLDAGGHMAGMWLWWVLAVAIVVAVAWGVTKSSSRSNPGQSESAEDLLKRRYAAGDIDSQEYEKRLHDLRNLR